MKRVAALALLSALGLFAGCASKEETQMPAAGSSPSVAVEPPAAPKSEGIAAASQSLQAGKFDEAAARLLEVKASGKELSQKEAADYREALQEAYARTLEAAQNGDPRAQASLQMIKAAIAR